MAYLTKDPSGLVQLWNNKPEFNKSSGFYFAWINRKENKNEIGIDVTENKYFRELFDRYKTPCCVQIELNTKLFKLDFEQRNSVNENPKNTIEKEKP